MSVAGLTGTPSRCSLWAPVRGRGPLSTSLVSGKPEGKLSFLHLQRSYLAGCAKLCVPRRSRAMVASYGGDMTNDRPVIFPKIHVKDPYQRLGISSEAADDEIQAARNFLVQQYAGHKPSVDAIESAYDKIIMEKFYEKTNPKVDINKKMREMKQSDFVQNVKSRFRTPSTKVILKTAITFLVLGALSVLFPTEDGPTLQVLTSFLATMYFIHDRLKSNFKAVLYTIGAFAFSWFVATVLMVVVIPPVPFINGLRSFEVISSLISYVLLWVASAYLQ